MTSNKCDINERYYTSSDGDKIYLKEWLPKNKPIEAILIATHGYCEHINRYHNFFTKLASQGIKILGYDQVGHGNTAKANQNSYARGNTLDKCLAILQDLINQERSYQLPLFLFGHSWGGAIVLTFLAKSKEVNLIEGVIVASPGIQLSEACSPGPIFKLLLPYLAYLFPRFMIEQRIDSYFISKDEEEVERYSKDLQVNREAELRMASQLISTGGNLLYKDYKVIECKNLYLLQGLEDPIVTLSEFKSFVAKLEQCNRITNLKVDYIEDCRHELHNDIKKDLILENYTKFIKDCLSGNHNDSDP